MNKLIAPIALLCAISAGLVFSCKKTKKSTAPRVSLNTVFANLRTTPQTLSVQAGRDTIVYGTKGTMLHFYTNSFKDAAGSTITSGTIGLSLVEMYKPGDMMQNRAPTTSGNNILKSGGQVNITAAVNGNEVFTNGYGIGFKQNASSSDGMSLFYGNNNNLDSTLNWDINDTGRAFSDESTFFRYIFESCTKFHFVNCDEIWSSSNQPSTNVSVVLPDNSFTPLNTEVFLVLPELNSVIVIGGIYDKSKNMISLNDDGIRVAIGVHYEIVVIANKADGFYYWQSSGTSTTNLTVTAALAKETTGDIQARMAGL